jgi:CRP-like cAMP-binding protein
MSVSTKPADLTKISLFRGLRDEDLRSLGVRSEVRTVPANAMLIKEGDAAEALFVILRGKVKVWLTDPHGKELVVDVRSAGQYVGEMMLDDNPRSASVSTLEPSEFVVVRRADFKALLGRNPDVALQVIRNLIRLARGHNVKTLEDVRNREELQLYIEQLKATKGQDLPSVKRWMTAKRWVLVGLLVFAVLQFYFLDVLLRTMSLRSITLFTGS